MVDPGELRSGGSGTSSSGTGGDQTLTLAGWMSDDVLEDLACPACGNDLAGDELFLSHRLCGTCRRHFSIPIQERLGLLIDPGTFRPLRHDDDGIESFGEGRGLSDALITGTASIGGVSSVVVMFDDHLGGGALGALLGDRVIHAMEAALSRRRPLVMFCAGGLGRMVPGPLAMVQGGRLASVAAQLHLSGVPSIAILTHPVADSLFTTIAAPCDLIFAEPGAGVRGRDARTGLAPLVAPETLATQGAIEGVIDREHLRAHLALALDLFTNTGVSTRPAAHVVSEPGRHSMQESIAALRTGDRPSGRRYADALFRSAVEFRGDRVAGHDAATICGVGRLDGVSVAFGILDRDADEPHVPEVSARMMSRLARIAGRLELPLVLMVDRCAEDPLTTVGAATSHALANLASVLAALPVPVISLAIGPVDGGVGQAAMAGDRQFMQEHAIYGTLVDVAEPRVPMGPRSTPGRASGGGSSLGARECLRLGLIDGIVAEPGSGAHSNPEEAIDAMRAALVQALAELAGAGQRRLLDTRRARQRTLGQSTPEGLAAAHSELWELQEWQRSVARSLDDLRDRWDQVHLRSPRIPTFQRPDLGDLATRLRARRAELLERAGLTDR